MKKTLKDFARGALAGPFLDTAELLAALEASGDAGVTFSSILIVFRRTPQNSAELRRTPQSSAERFMANGAPKRKIIQFLFPRSEKAISVVLRPGRRAEEEGQRGVEAGEQVAALSAPLAADHGRLETIRYTMR